MAQFKRAAEQLAEQQMVIEDRLAKWLRQWCEEWERDLEARPDEVKQSLEGAWGLGLPAVAYQKGGGGPASVTLCMPWQRHRHKYLCLG